MEKALFNVLGREVEFYPDPNHNPERIYTISRLSYQDGQKFGAMLSEIFVTAHITGETMLENFLVGSKDQGFGQAIMSLVISFPQQIDKIYAFLAPMLKDENKQPFTVEDFGDADKFPLPSMWTLCEALSNHPDIQDFFSGGRKLNQRLLAQYPQAAAFVKKLSSPSDGNPENSQTTSGGSEPLTSSGPVTDSEIPT